MDKDETRRVAALYDNLSASYNELYGSEQSIKHERVVDILRNTNPTILIDIGCGTGNFLQRSKGLYKYGVGIDLSKRMLQIAKDVESACYDVVQAASSSLPIKDGAVDCAVSISTWKADQQLSQLTREVTRISRQNSTLAITVFQDPDTPAPQPLAGAEYSSRISTRETLYLLRLD